MSDYELCVLSDASASHEVTAFVREQALRVGAEDSAATHLEVATETAFQSIVAHLGDSAPEIRVCCYMQGDHLVVRISHPACSAECYPTTDLRAYVDAVEVRERGVQGNDLLLWVQR